ncbi:MAG: TetR/AcrR family transcriptional regulator [Kofleriaceae bacterium]
MTAHSAERGAGAKRERILDAAERVFARHGFFAAKVAEIAREADVADGTIYIYFKSKDDLLISLFESRMERVNQLLAAAVQPTDPPQARLAAYVRTYLALVGEQPSVAEVLTVELRQSSKFMKAYANPHFAELLRTLGSIIADGQTAGVFDRAIPAPIAARMVFGVLDELATAWLLGRGETAGRGARSSARKFDIVRAAEWAATMATRGLMAPGAAAHAAPASPLPGASGR